MGYGTISPQQYQKHFRMDSMYTKNKNKIPKFNSNFFQLLLWSGFLAMSDLLTIEQNSAWMCVAGNWRYFIINMYGNMFLSYFTDKTGA